MATNVTLNGNIYSIPAYQDTGYAQGNGNLSSYLVALATGVLTLAGGNFTLTADANFGASYGLVSTYFKSRSSNIATAGAIRLANTDLIEWRNNANDNNLILAMNATATGTATYTIPDVSGSASFVMTAGTQTIGGSKTFSADMALTKSVPALTLTDSSTGASFIRLQTNSNNVQTFVGTENSAGNYLFTGSTAYATCLGSYNNYPLQFFVNNALCGSFAATSGAFKAKGTATNDDAAAGYIGEYVTSAVASGSAVSATGNGQYFDVTSITLSAGDWDVSCVVGGVLNGATSTEFAGGTATSSGNTSTGWALGDTSGEALPPTTASTVTVSIPNARKSLSGSTTIYLKATFLYSAGTPKAFGRISARRVR